MKLLLKFSAFQFFFNFSGYMEGRVDADKFTYRDPIWWVSLFPFLIGVAMFFYWFEEKK